MFEGVQERLLPSLLAVALLGAAALGGCGDDESTVRQEPRVSKASESPTTFAERLAKLLATTTTKKDCRQLEAINNRSATSYPCPVPKGLRKSMSTFTVVGAREYGTGAVVDYTSRKSKNGAAIVLAVAPDRNWGVNRFGVITKPSTHTSDEESRAGFDDTVDSYLKAVRTRDCGGYIEVAFTNGVRRKKDICTIIFAGTTGLAKRLKANPSAKPNYEGGNATYGFYTLETNKPSPASATISVIRDEEGAEQPYLVLDVTPSPTTAEQRKARRAAQQAKRNQGNLEPSSKPSDPAVTTP